MFCFADAWTSPNDPIFFAHHANVDRSLMVWQRRHNGSAPTYGFPAERMGAVAAAAGYSNGTRPAESTIESYNVRPRSRRLLCCSEVNKGWYSEVI